MRSIEARRQRLSAPRRAEIRTHVPDREVAAMQNVRFSTAIRGYERDEVHRYITRVNTLLAELQITQAPEPAIQAALEETSREHREVIEEARAVAAETTARSRTRADDRIQEATEEARKLVDAATREAHEVREAAEERVRELESEIEKMIQRHTGVIEELRDLAASLDGVAKASGDRSAARESESEEADVTA